MSRKVKAVSVARLKMALSKRQKQAELAKGPKVLAKAKEPEDNPLEYKIYPKPRGKRATLASSVQYSNPHKGRTGADSIETYPAGTEVVVVREHHRTCSACFKKASDKGERLVQIWLDGLYRVIEPEKLSASSRKR